MNFLCVTESTLAFCGRRHIHMYTLKSDYTKATLRSEYSGSDSLVSLDLHKYLPPVKTDIERASVICCNLTEDGNHLCAADSEKNVFVFSKIREDWEHFASFALERRVLKVQFDNDAKNLIIVDKCGAVFVSSMEDKNTVTILIKIHGISALTLDTVLSLNNHQMLTCDGQIKMFVTRFPDASEIKAYSFGQAETIANLLLFNRDQQLLTVSGEGFLKIWNMADHRCLKTFNLFQIMHGIKHSKNDNEEVKRAKLTEAFGHNYFAVKIMGYKQIPVFELILLEREPSIRQLGQVNMESEFCDFGWLDNYLFTYNPEIEVVIKRFHVSSKGVLYDPKFQVPHLSELRLDFRAFVDFMKSTLTLRKHFSSDLIRLSQGQKLMNAFVTAAEKRIPRLVRGSKTRASDLVFTEMDVDGKLPIPVPLKYFKERGQTESASPTPGPSVPPIPVSKQQSGQNGGSEEERIDTPYITALNHYPRLMEVTPNEDSEESAPIQPGPSRMLQNLLRKSQETPTSSTPSTAEENDGKDVQIIVPSISGKTRASSIRGKTKIVSKKVVEIITPDDEVTKISKSTLKPFMDNMSIGRTKGPIHWPTELQRYVSSRPQGSEMMLVTSDEGESENEDQPQAKSAQTATPVKPSVPGTVAPK